MRVALLCHATFGGSGVIATELGLALARGGHEVHFVCAARPPRLGSDQPNVTFHRVATPTHPLFPQGEFGLALASKLVELGPRLDVIHAHYAIPLATSAVLAREALGAKAPALVTTVHGTDVLTVGNDPALAPMVRLALQRSDAVTAPSAFLAQRARDAAQVEVETIANFVDTERFTPAVMAPRARVVTHNSNFRSLKRIEDVLELARRIGDAQFVLLGDGPERPAAEAFIARHGLRNVQLAGEQQDVVPFLQRSTVFLLPSEVESFGLAALEAMSCGVPVVASRVGGLPEVVTDGQTGWLHDVADVDAMEGSVRRLLDNAALHERFATAARETAVTRFRLAPTVARYEALYERISKETK
ncbi:MAG: N-acetyl-alpha-D-glucosaminyl L-malate synthase BshA [Myxococcaceae bacterium]